MKNYPCFSWNALPCLENIKRTALSDELGECRCFNRKFLPNDLERVISTRTLYKHVPVLTHNMRHTYVRTKIPHMPCTHTHTHTHTHAWTRTFKHPCTHPHMHPRTHAHTYTHTRAHAHTSAHARTHTNLKSYRDLEKSMTLSK